MPETKGRPKLRKAKHRVKKEYCTFIVEIKDWEMTYLFSLDRGNMFSEGPYMEFPHLEIKGVIRQPEKYAGKEMSATFMGDREMFPRISDRSHPERKPLGVGSLTLRGENRQYLGSLPHDSLPTIVNLLEYKRIQFFHLHGLIPHRGHTLISSVRFFRNYNPEDK